MQNLRLAIYIAVFGLGASCAPRPKLVYVDIERAALPSESNIKPRSLSTRPAPIPGKTSEIGGLPKRVVSFPVSGDPLREARAVVAKSEQDAVREIAQRLSKTYLSEVNDLFEKKKREIEPLQRESLDKVFIELRKRFEVYAERRSPLLVVLASKVGWPDPDPGSLIEPDESNPRRLGAFKVAKSLREQIKALDTQYDKDIEGLFASQKAGAEQAMADLSLQIEELRAKKLEVAEAEARKQVESTRDQIHSLVVGDPSVTLDSVPKKEVAFPSASPRVLPRLQPIAHDSSLQEAKADLAVWLAQNRYELAPKGRARDATKDFIEWRNRKVIGR